MLKFHKTVIPAAALAALLCGHPAALAAPSWAGSADAVAPPTDFLSAALTESRASTAPGDDASPFADSAAAVELTGPARRNPLSINVRGAADVVLWNLVAMVSAHQQGRMFDLAETHVATLPLGDPVSTVPLPGALWLFLMGLLGLAGSRVTGVGRGATVGAAAGLRLPVAAAA
ncbi:MAG TPA: hypothetical protein VLI72_10620 [Methylibium sp.]|nr:hypothetical protein [Methylibium sp.]